MEKDPLFTVLKLACDAEEKAALQLKSIQSDKQKYQGQLEVLNNYRLDYMKQMGQQQGKTLSANHYSQFHQFIKQVDNAISQQVNVLKDAETQVIYRQNNWQEKQQKRKAVEMLLDQKAQKRVHAENLREQKMSDEFAMQQFIRKKPRQ
ncbi:flagellar export protein FliJ [Shewanella sp. SR44-3]|uniref:flagellar export protein FliJ n=1 Tax=Shewanella sp. SR44-3 TaxID=2760936 RepID=UPI0015FA1E80|nr:flagellar export protein FliJ [Shewanella sp. SR44-3]MBB1268078.1 flagellar export protein FliJ [Shewanella sp. SR44-3]